MKGVWKRVLVSVFAFLGIALFGAFPAFAKENDWAHAEVPKYSVEACTSLTAIPDNAIPVTLVGYTTRDAVEYTQTSGCVSVVRKGVRYQLENSVPIRVRKVEENASATLDLSAFQQFGGEYSRQSGDLIIVEGGSWKYGVNEFTLSLFALEIKEDTNASVIKLELLIAKALRTQYQERVAREYPASLYRGADLTAYEEYVAALGSASKIAAVNGAFKGIENLQYMKMVIGASVRLHTNENGLRFMAELGKNYDENATYYVMIVPYSYVTRFGVTGNYYEEIYKKLQEETGESEPYLATMKALPFQYTEQEVQASGGALKADCWYVRGSLTSLQIHNYGTDFFGIVYKVDESGSSYAHFTDGQNVRSIQTVAQRALEDTTATYTERETKILQAYVSGAALDEVIE